MHSVSGVPEATDAALKLSVIDPDIISFDDSSPALDVR
jgi:hypothetical protein